MSKRVTLTTEDMTLIIESLNGLCFISNSTGLRQRVKQITDKFSTPIGDK